MRTIEQKKEMVASVIEDLKSASAIYLLNFQGLTVEKDNALRKELNKKGIRYRAVKNTLLGIALKEVGIEGLDKYLEGCSAIMLGTEEEPNVPAKEIVAFHKANPDKLPVKAITLDGEFISGSKIEDVSKMPGRLELIASIVGIVLGPGAQLVSIIKGPGATIAGQVKAIEEKLEG